MTTKEQLRKEIEEKKAELEKLEKLESNQLRSNAIKSLDEYSDEQKISTFDGLYNSALKDLESKERGGEDRDETYTWEDVMELLARDSSAFWKYYHSL